MQYPLRAVSESLLRTTHRLLPFEKTEDEFHWHATFSPRSCFQHAPQSDYAMNMDLFLLNSRYC